MAERARGTVTFLFTDLEGSTQLLKQLRERYGGVLAEHQRILREAFAAGGGEEVDTQGDAFFYVFPRARDAAAAAAEAQRALAAHEWPDGLELRVRMGMHTAEPDVSDEGRYHGLGVHRTARIMGAGHGGQILASQATASVLEDDEPPGIRPRYLGEYRLKDLDRPERIYQLDVAGLPQRFPPPHAASAARFWTRRRLAVTGGAALAAAGAAIALAVSLGGDGQALSQVDANAIGLIDPESGQIAEQVDVGVTPTHLAVGEGAIWITNADGDAVLRIDPQRNAVVQTIAVGSSPSRITTGSGAVWVSNSLDRTVSRIDPATNTVVQRIPVGNLPVGIAHANGSIWVANTGDDTITRIDPATGTPAKVLAIAATELAYGAGTLWASQRTANRVVRIDPGSGRVAHTIAVGNGPSGLAFGAGSAWVANTLDGTVSRIDPTTNSVRSVIPVGNGPGAVAVGHGGVWVSNEFDGTLARIDPRTNQVTHVRVGNRPQGVALSDSHVLVSVRQSGAGHRGGTLRVRMSRDLDSIDPAMAYDTASWAILRMTNDGLVAFNQASGLAGTQLVPNLAVSLPAPTDGGTTYTFRLRPNIRYSNGTLLEASDFRSTFERLYKTEKLSVAYFDGIVGAAQCKQRPRRCDLRRGIETDDRARTVSFHLVAPDPEFVYTLGIPTAYVLPAATATRATTTRPLTATGPYVIASYQPKRLIRLVRNRYFRERSQAAQPDGYPDEIRFTIGGTADDAVQDVLSGKADVFSSSLTQTPPSREQMTELRTRYASQLHTNPQAGALFLSLNTKVPPFDRLDVRRAVNYAADRAAAVDAAGGPDVAQATCQVLPPHFPGYQPYCPFTAGAGTNGAWTAPDLAKARALVAASGTSGMHVTVWSWADLEAFGPYMAKLLRSLGYRVSIKVVGGFDYFLAVSDSRTRAQISIAEWIPDYPAASGFFKPLTCAAFVPRSPLNVNASQFCDPQADRQIVRAIRAQATNPATARRLWEDVDRRVTDQAPQVSLVNPKAVDVLARRVGNYQFTPACCGLLIDQLWVK